MVNKNAAVKLLFLLYLSPINSEKKTFLKLIKKFWFLVKFVFEVVSQVAFTVKALFFFKIFKFLILTKL
jgi:hypothetical protein